MADSEQGSGAQPLEHHERLQIGSCLFGLFKAAHYLNETNQNLANELARQSGKQIDISNEQNAFMDAMKEAFGALEGLGLRYGINVDDQSQ